ncbi:MAG: hypothetical protein MUO19_02395 [Dehalococcoidales bacterium]|nr:hypothetical protein [Dehalococcoidales bacterium]
MSIEWFRDLVIVIFGLGATVAVVIFVVMAFMLFFRIRPILDSVRATTKTVENLSHSVEEEVAKPLAQVISFVQGIRQATGLFSKFTRKKEDD